MTDEELIARLRGWARDIQEGSKAIWAMDQDLKEAADRIEALVKDKRWIMEERDRTFALMLARAEKAEARAERLEAALREILEKPRNADLTYAELFAEVVSEARAALKGDDHE